MLRGTLLAAAMLAAAVLAAAPVAARAQAPAPASPERPAFVVTFIEVAPTGAAETKDILKQVAMVSRKETGNLRYEALQREDWPSHFAIIEVWRDGKAFESHAGGAAMAAFRAKLKPLQTGHYDERPSLGIGLGPLQAAGTAAAAAVYVLDHIDVTGNFKDQAIVMLNKLAEDVRKEPGNERFEVWEQANRLNHFNVNEVWASRAAYDAHIVGPETKAFRETIGPALGALYDAQIYRAIQ